MSIYSLSSCMLENSKNEKCYITGVLHKFAEQSNKVAVDKDGIILDIYSDKAKNDHNIAYWLDIMSMEPSNFETVSTIPENIISEILEVFIFVASKIPSSPKLIVYSTSILNGDYELDKKSKFEYENKKIKVLDRDDAFNHFNKKRVVKKTIIKDSIVAKDKGKIRDVKK